ncbi:hypothetical protein MSAN_00056300 [Mycena sanguinolenta]|uniref:BTB domain-containing protein n=1 Tax=Mycena sanguinolenta TaxID=230812 RepID=A0A8H7DL69_9AGAR|nr:hypothetical protein MSAN_00056300 [Mycena sanguinolenta]
MALGSEARVPHLYFEDGNIVLSARNSENCTQYFRVHRSVLAKHSPVFADMFTVPLPSTVDEYDGVPVVSMAGDDADDLEAFLSLLYNPEDISQILEQWDFTWLLLAPCKLAKKYLVDWIRNMAASQLKKSWPTTAAGWFSFVDDEKKMEFRDCVQAVSGRWDPDWDDVPLQLRSLPDPASSILLARECDAPSILPFAFLDLLRSHALYENKFNLSPDDAHRLLVARERIGDWFNKQADYCHYPWAMAACGSPKPCQITLLRTWTLLSDTVCREGHVLRQVESNGYHQAGEMCPECETKVRNKVGKLQNSFVAQLDTFFQLDK